MLLLAVPFSLAQNGLNSYSNEQLLGQANFYYAQGDCRTAQFLFQKVLERDAKNTQALIGKGKTLACQNAYDLAISAFKSAIASDAKSTDAYVQLAKAYYNEYLQDATANALSEALQVAKQGEGAAGPSAGLENIKGIVYYYQKDYPEAKTAFEQAVSLASAGDADMSKPDLSKIYVNLGRTYRQLEQKELMVTAFQRAVTLNPSNPEAHTQLGLSYKAQNNCDQAIFELTQANTLDPHSLEAASNLGITLFQCNHVKEAVPVLQQALKIDPVSIPPLHTYLARAYIQQGKFDDAVEEAQKGALLPPVSADALYWLGQAYEARGQSGDQERAKEAYQRALKLDPNNTLASAALKKLE
jgi:tetratricopeptide (TPR) repeat protein